MEQSTCKVEGCGRPPKQRGRCSGHAARFTKTGISGGQLAEYRPRPEQCIEPGCGRPVRAKDRCSTHYARMASGSTFTGSITRPGRPSLPRQRRQCRGCGQTVERLHPGFYVLCSECHAKPAKLRRSYYGRTWRHATAAVRERDGGRCRSCGRTEQEEGRRLATAHIVPFDVGLALGWPESRIHHLPNLLLLCCACHRAFDYRPEWAYRPDLGGRPQIPDWGSEQRPEDLAAWVVEFYPDLVTAALAARPVV